MRVSSGLPGRLNVYPSLIAFTCSLPVIRRLSAVFCMASR